MEHNRPAWLHTQDGSHEFSRIFWLGDRYDLRHGFDRFGASRLIHCAVTVDAAELRWSCGRVTQIPRSWFSLTYKP